MGDFPHRPPLKKVFVKFIRGGFKPPGIGPPRGSPLWKMPRNFFGEKHPVKGFPKRGYMVLGPWRLEIVALRIGPTCTI